MAIPAILYTDYTLVTYSASLATASNGDVDNLKYGWTGDKWVSATSASNQFLLMDFGNAFPQKSRNFVLIDGHNLDSIISGSGGSVYLQASPTRSFTSGTINVVTFNVRSGLSVSASTAQVYYTTFSPNSERYWRMIYSSSAALTEPPQIGRIVVDTKLDFQFPYNWNYKKENQRFETSVEKTAIDGTLLSSYTYGGRLMYELQFPRQNDTFSGNFQTFHDTIKGKLYPFYFLDADGVTIRKMKLDTDYTPIEVQRFGQNVLNTLTMKSMEVSNNWYQTNLIPSSRELSGDDIYCLSSDGTVLGDEVSSEEDPFVEPFE